MTNRNHLTKLIYDYDRHMIVHMTGLYTRLVTYARLYILTLVVPCYHDISYILFIVCYWYWLFCYLLFSDYHVITYIVFLCTSTFLFTHTLIRSLLMTLDSHVQGIGHFFILFKWSCDRTLRKKLEFLSFDSSILASCYSYFCTLLDFMYIRFSLYSSSFMWYHVWMLICDIAVIVDSLCFRFIACSDYS